MQYGFIGLGNLGRNLAGSLIREGFEVTITDLDRRNAEPLLAKGRAGRPRPKRWRRHRMR